jgi:hypothetical protein
VGDSLLILCTVARCAGSFAFIEIAILGLAPQALCFLPLRGPAG